MHSRREHEDLGDNGKEKETIYWGYIRIILCYTIIYYNIPSPKPQSGFVDFVLVPIS